MKRIRPVKFTVDFVLLNSQDCAYFVFWGSVLLFMFIIVNRYDQEIPQSQTAYNPVAPRGRAAQPSRDNRKTN